jgi:uncharacterized membrane protein
MTLYELLLFIHVAASIVWIGAGFLSLVLATTYDRESDEAAIKRFLHDQEWLAMKLFVPSSLVVVIMGIALVIESDAWTFGYLWIVLGLVGYAATFVTGFFFLRPASERVGQEMERQGGRLTPQLHRRQRPRDRRAGAGGDDRLGQPTASWFVTVVSASSMTVTAKSISSSLTVSGGAIRRQLAEPAL